MKKSMILIIVLLISGCSSSTFDKDNAIYQIKSAAHRQCMGYIIHDDEDHTIVIDGGGASESIELINKVKEIDKDDTIDGWFITHYHDDHTGALVKYLTSDNLDVTIKNVYSQLASEESVKFYEPGRLQNVVDVNNVMKTVPTKTVKSGQKIKIGNMTIDVLRNINYSITNNFGNNTSIVYKAKLNNHDILFLGDLGYEGSNELLQQQKDQIENVEYLQAAHHGQNGGNEALYQKVNPKYILWPTTKWIYTNTDGKYNTNETKKWLKGLNIKKNYLAYKKLYKIKLD